MNNNCKFARGGYCMCSTCQVVREAMEEAGKVTLEEASDIFYEMEKMLKEYQGDNEGETAP